VEEEQIEELHEEGKMAEVEKRRVDAVVDLREADMSDEIRFRNARHERGFRLQSKGTLSQKWSGEDERRARDDVEDAELAKRAFAKRKVVDVEDLIEHDASTNVGSQENFENSFVDGEDAPAMVLGRRRAHKRKSNFERMLGIKKLK